MIEIVRDRSRVHRTAEVFTPQWLVDEMLMTLFRANPGLFYYEHATFLEPSCGDGNFLVRMVHYKITLNRHRLRDKRVPMADILESIFGIDLMPDNVQVARHRVLEVVAEHRGCSVEKARAEFGHIVDRNIACGSALEWDFDNWCRKGETPTHQFPERPELPTKALDAEKILAAAERARLKVRTKVRDDAPSAPATPVPAVAPVQPVPQVASSPVAYASKRDRIIARRKRRKAARKARLAALIAQTHNHMQSRMGA